MSAQSERGEQSTTCADRLQDNHVVISESRMSRLAVWSDNGFQKDNTTFAGLQKHNLFTSCFIIEKMHGLLCSTRTAASRITRIVQKRVRAALSERLPSDYLSIRRRSGISGLPCAYNNFQNQTATEIKLEFIIHFIHKYVCMRKQIDAAETQAESSLPFRL